MNPTKIFVTVDGLKRSLAWLIDNASAATYVRVINNPGLTALPDLPAATYVWVENNPGLLIMNAGIDHRGFQFVAVFIRKEWRIIAGCRNYSLEYARHHWRNNPEAIALVEKLADAIATVSSCS